MVSPSSTVCVLLFLRLATNAGAFSRGIRPAHSIIVSAPSRLNRVAHPRLLRASSDGEEYDDDGWGERKVSDKERELVALQLERQQRQDGGGTSARVGSSSSPGNNTGQEDGQERDLFIPIFALISLAGLFGSYGYEMARLYSRGELYLPWEQ